MSLPILASLILFGCNSVDSQKTETVENPTEIKVVGAMKNVMWKGELQGSIALDSISKKEGLYAIGPLEFLAGEVLILEGKSYVSYVQSDSTMRVEENFAVKAPFLVYANQTEWTQEPLPQNVKNLKELENYISQKTQESPRPFVFKLKGTIEDAVIHIQNLPSGTTVSSPKEAHQGQVNYSLTNTEVEIVGFFSTEHQGVFTHHDSYAHMHLITSDRNEMGHLDEIVIGEKMSLYLPKN
jgi:acetolactate decarboxylase